VNKEILESQWTEIRPIIREKFSNLSDEDIRQINGHYDQLVAKLQQKYGYSREEAEDRIRNWNFDRFANSRVTPREDKTYREDKVRVEDDNSFLKWLLAIGIPLLLLGGYFMATRTPEEPTVTNQQNTSETSTDFALSNTVRTSLRSQLSASEIQSVQITTNNGVVTLTGTVPSREVSNSVANIAQNTAGVTQVNNRLQVR
jgi:uncharacterized protein YjbJ (UPF0337 family)